MNDMMAPKTSAASPLPGGDSVDGGEPIAIIGMAGRFPGAANLDQFWDNLRNGREGIHFFSDEELQAAGIPAARFKDPNFVKAAPILEDIEHFDAGFFGLSHPEAAITDPQQRLFMECAWHALEDAGVDPQRAGGQVGVFAGSSLSGYLFFNLRHTFTVSEGGIQSLIGNDKDYLASQTSYRLDLQGPSVGVQTACSTSLVAVHLGCQSLLNGETDLALAGGVTVKVPHRGGYQHQEGGVFSPDGHCRPFDADAQGTIFGSGVGVVVLRRLKDALARGDRIYAVIRGSAVNNDGSRKVGFTAPSEDGQVRVISEALDIAEVDPATVGFVEAHGTGTSLGDPIEVAALKTAYQGAEPGSCALGAVKSNVGHLESAAGIVGLIKAALAVHHGEIPPTLHFEKSNPFIRFEGSPFYVNTACKPWPKSQGRRRAGVSSFGIGGTNAHLILEQAPPRGRDPAFEGARVEEVQLLPFSAADPTALRALAGEFGERLAGLGAGERVRLAAAAVHRRKPLGHRLALVFDPQGEDSGSELRSYARTGSVGSDGSLSVGRVRKDRRPQVVFVFPGQGSQWHGMGRQLIAREPVFREAIEECAAVLERHAGWSLLEVLNAPEEKSRLGEVDVVQPTLFAIQVALSALWRSWGIEPSAVIGHSLGEVAASCVAGALSLDDAAKVVCRRSRLALRLRGVGGMAVVERSAEALEEIVAGTGGAVAIAGHNSPRSTILSGDTAALEAVIARLEKDGVYCRFVKVDFASHCSQVDPLLPELKDILSDLRPRSAPVPIFSTVVGRESDGAELDADYWCRNLRQPVLLKEMVELASRGGHDHFLEISPHPILVPFLNDCIAERGEGEAYVLPSLRRDEDERRAMLESLGALYSHGCPVRWEGPYPGPVPHRDLPLYPFQRQRHWIDPPADGAAHRDGMAVQGGGEHRLLRGPLRSSLHPRTSFWQLELSAEALPEVADARDREAPSLPSVYLLELALAAGSQNFAGRMPRLESVTLAAPPTLRGGEERLLQVALAPAAGNADGIAFQINAAVAEKDGAPGWGTLAAGIMKPPAESGEPDAPALSLEQARERCDRKLGSDAFYQRLREGGQHWGPAFRIVREIRHGSGCAVARLEIPRADSAGEMTPGHLLHPALLAGAAQLLRASALDDDMATPLEIVRVDSVHGSLPDDGAMWGYAVLEPPTDNDREQRIRSTRVVRGDVVLCDQDGAPSLQLEGVEARWRPDQWMYRIDWQEEEAPPAPAEPGNGASAGSPGDWLLFADSSGIGEAVRERLLAEGSGSSGVVTVMAGKAFERTAADRFTLRPEAPEDFHRLQQALMDGPPRRGILYLWGIDARIVEGGDDPCADAVRRCCDGLLHLTQSLAADGVEAPPLSVVTRGAHRVEPREECPAETGEENSAAVAQGLLWGLSGAVANELTRPGCRTVDLSPVGKDEALDAEIDTLVRLVREAPGGAAAGARTALRGDRCFQARLVPYSPLDQGNEAPVRNDGSYLITGGLGGLGLLCAQKLAAMGARHLALLGRSAPSKETENVLDALRRDGVEILPLRADVTSRGDLERALKEVFEKLPPLAGVIHAAGVREGGDLQDGLLRRQTAERFHRVLAPKVAGAWNLHSLTRDKDLDFFVLFSSIATLFGSLGQSSYAAANSFLDGLAQYRRDLGLPALSIDWGPWAKVGMAAGLEGREEYVAYEGLSLMAPEDGLECFERLLALGRRSPAQMPVMAFRHALWKRSNPKASAVPLFAALTMGGGAGEEATGTLTDQLAEIPAGKRSARIESYLLEQVAEALRIAPESIDPGDSLSRLGLSSLRSLEVRNRLEAALGLNIPIVQFLQSESLHQFALHLAERIALEQLLEGAARPLESEAEDEEWETVAI